MLNTLVGTLFLVWIILFAIALIRPSVLRLRRRSIILPLFIVLGALSFLSIRIFGIRNTRAAVTLYAKSKINVYDCQSENCNLIETDYKGASWNFKTKPNGDWVSINTTNLKPGFIRSSDVTEEVPVGIVLKKSGNARSCPSFDCNISGYFNTGQDFAVFKSDDKGDWYGVEAFDVKDRAKIVTYYLHKSLFGENVPVPASAKSIQVAADASQSGPPAILYAKSYSKIFECKSDKCKILEEAPPGTSWNLPFTPKGEWLGTKTLDGQKNGYIKLADLISKEQFPKRCNVSLAYGIGYVSPKFIENGFDKARIAALAQKATEKWEDSLDLKLFNYSSEEIRNLINSRTYSYQVSEPYYWGTAFPSSLPNGAVLAFEIAVYEKVFDYYNKLSSDYYVNVSKDKFLENEILRILMHEFGHAIGFIGRIPGSQNIMFEGLKDTGSTQTVSFEEWEKRGKTPPELTQADITALQNWCAGN